MTCRFLTIVLVSCGVALCASVTKAQTRITSASVAVGTGMTVGSGQASAVAQRTPMFVDVAVRTWTNEDSSVAIGGSVRAEIDGRASVAVVPRAELQWELGPLLVRPGIAAPIFFAPFSMAGVEGSFTIHLDLIGPLGAVGAIAFDAFFLGSDVPDDSVVLMFNGMLGADIVF